MVCVAFMGVLARLGGTRNYVRPRSKLLGRPVTDEFPYNCPRMPICKGCGEEVETLTSVKVAGKSKKLCEDCADRAREEGEIAEASESVVQNMMGFKGRR